LLIVLEPWATDVVVYANARCIVIRSLARPLHVRFYTEHQYATTAGTPTPLCLTST
jgi:hypothetical protein